MGRLKAALEQGAPPDDFTSTAEIPLTRTSGSHKKPD